MHKLHTFEYRLNRRGKGKIKKIRRKCATVAPYLAASNLRSHAPAPLPPSPSLMERGLGGLTSIGFLPLGAGLFPRSAFLSFSTLLFLLRFLLVQNCRCGLFPGRGDGLRPE